MISLILMEYKYLPWFVKTYCQGKNDQESESKNGARELNEKMK